MSAYKLLKNGVLRTADLASIPPDTGNTDWLAYQSWLGQGNIPDPVDPDPQSPSPDDLEAQVQACLNGGAGPNIDPIRLFKAKFVSDLAFRLNKAPGALTPQDLTAERNRIAAIYKAL